MAAYVDIDFLENSYGRGWVTAVRNAGIDLDVAVIPTATAIVQSLLRARGFATPTTTGDPAVKAAVGAACVHQMSMVHEVKVELSADWAAHPHRLMLDALADMSDPTRFQPDPAYHPVSSTVQATGGSEFSQDRITSSSQSRPARASRDQLTGY